MGAGPKGASPPLFAILRNCSHPHRENVALVQLADLLPKVPEKSSFSPGVTVTTIRVFTAFLPAQHEIASGS